MQNYNSSNITPSLKNKINKISSVSLSLPQGFMMTSHSGALDTKPNTLESIEVLLKNDSQCVEFDLTFRPDGTPCIIHKKNPAQNEGEELEPVLEAISNYDGCRVNLDVKNFSNLTVIDDLLKKYNLFERSFYTGVFEKQAEILKNSSELPFYINRFIPIYKKNSEKYMQWLSEKIIGLGALGINCQYGFVSDTMCNILHKNGLLVSAWTADKINVQCSLLAKGVDNITTRHPDMLDYCIKNWERF